MFKRLIIRLRWPMAIAAMLAIAAVAWSAWYYVIVGIQLNPLGRYIYVTSVHGNVSVKWVPGTGSSSYYGVVPVAISQFQSLGWRWWTFDFTEFNPVEWGPNQRIDFPAWTILIPPLALAFLGFRAKRRQTNSDQCGTCRYILAGALTCPECGRSAPSN